MLRQHLDRDVASEARVARSIHLAHAAGAERRDDLVRPEPRAGGERHGRRNASCQFCSTTTDCRSGRSAWNSAMMRAKSGVESPSTKSGGTRTITLDGPSENSGVRRTSARLRTPGSRDGVKTNVLPSCDQKPKPPPPVVTWYLRPADPTAWTYTSFVPVSSDVNATQRPSGEISPLSSFAAVRTSGCGAPPSIGSRHTSHFVVASRRSYMRQAPSRLQCSSFLYEWSDARYVWLLPSTSERTTIVSFVSFR